MPAHAKRYDGYDQKQHTDDSAIFIAKLVSWAHICETTNRKVAERLGFVYVPAVGHGPMFPDLRAQSD